LQDAKKSNIFRNPSLLVRGFFPYIWLFVGLFVLFTILSPYVRMTGSAQQSFSSFDLYDGDKNVRLFMAVFLYLLLVAAVIIMARRAMTLGKALIIVAAAGIVLRFGTMLYTPFYVHGHDVGGFDGYGHLAYVYRLFTTGALPDSYSGQFYHPPLAHLADAAVVRLYALLSGQSDPDTIFEAAKIVPCFASCGLLIVTYRLFGEFDFSKQAKLIAMTVIALHPTFILLSASINNDMLMVFFFMAAFLYTICWYKTPSYKNILLIAVFIGCAMSTKFSGALVAVFTAAVFLVVFIRAVKKKKSVPLLAQFGAFAVVCFPLGLWYSVRNKLLFGQPFGYVAQIGRDSALYVGDHSVFERFLSFNPVRLFQTVFCDPWTDFNLWEYTVKCSLFGEFTFSDAHRVFAIVCDRGKSRAHRTDAICHDPLRFFRPGEKPLAVLSLGSLWAWLPASILFFNIRYPFGCTMDFRYIVPTVITGAGFLGLLFERLAESRRNQLLRIGFWTVLAVFCAATAGFYII
jgi:4-amino-4-deoxy-L-arabinose transferase-like glycosyltransferase